MVVVGRSGGRDSKHNALGCPLVNVINNMLELITEWDWQSAETLFLWCDYFNKMTESGLFQSYKRYV